ncbi:hypothetical protein GCM10023084_02760 [Streptomyces lacrimifluminis]|uniref:zinc finger domain-containing protein n=1 Tax=Streptomyces lacrimifluminis TaxID=1500077 RepID=UPI0031EB7D62
MNPEYVPELIAKIAMADPRVKRDDPIERRAQLQMWAGILADVPMDFAVQAAQQHYADSQWPIVPGDIAGRWQAVVRDRMRRDNGTFEPTDYPWLSPDDIGGYLRALRERRQAVAVGELPPQEIKALIAGTAARQAKKRIAELGDYLTTEVRTELAPYRPGAAEREQAIAAGGPDPLSAACPYEHCRAPEGRPCRNKDKRARKTPHPSRVEAAAGGVPQTVQRPAGAWPEGASSTKEAKR